MDVKIIANRFYLDVRYAEKDDAKQKERGGIIQVRKWYMPDGVDAEFFCKWFQGANPNFTEGRYSLYI